MTSLQKRLRELSKEKFESLVHQYLLQKYPCAGIKKVDGIGGDEGIDSFSGVLSDGPAIWQSKHFPDRIRSSQKKQILRSIKVAFELHRPKRWILCVPIDLRTTEHKWFQSEVVEKYGQNSVIELIGAAEILHELVHNRPLRDAFFPEESISNLISLRKLMTSTEAASIDQLERKTIEMAQQYLEGNVDLDPRLEPVVSIGLSKTQQVNRRPPGTVLSVKRGPLVIDYSPRDPNTYNLNPISFQLILNRTNSKNLEKAINTGAPLRLPVGAIAKLNSSSPLLQDLFRTQDLTTLQMEVCPAVPAAIASREFPMRLVAGKATKSNEIPYLPLKVTQFGRKEITLSSCSRLPMEVIVKINTPPKQGASITIRPIISGADAVEIAKVFEFIDALEQSGMLEVFSLDPPGQLFSDTDSFKNRLRVSDQTRNVLSDLATISTFFNTPLNVPETVTREEKLNIDILKRIATGEEFTGATIAAGFVKDPIREKQYLEFLGGMPMSARIEQPPGWQIISLFGKTIDCGPVTMTAEKVIVFDGDKSLKEYLEAPAGTTIRWKANCNGNCRFISGLSGLGNHILNIK
jgi:hypothetical protein